MPDTEAKLLREILDAQLELVCRFRRDGTIVYANKAYADSIGATGALLAGRSLWDFVSPHDRAHVEAQIGGLTPDNPKVQVENRFETVAGTRWTLWRNVALEFDDNGQWLVAQSSGFDITERKQLEEQRELLLDELNHRVRNTLMVVQGMAQQSFKGDNVPREQLASFNARLHALAAAHTALSDDNWTGASLTRIVREGLLIAGHTERASFAGPDLTLRPGAAVALVLVLHELATNAVKYGALSNPFGQIAVEWWRDPQDCLNLVWVESGGPTVAPPSRTGFGTRLIRSSITGPLGGEVQLDYAPGGLTCRMRFPLQQCVAAGAALHPGSAEQPGSAAHPGVAGATAA